MVAANYILRILTDCSLPPKKLLFPSLITEVNVCDKFNFCIGLVTFLVDQIHAGAQSTLTVRWGDTQI